MSANRQIAKNLFLNIGVFVINTGISFFLSPYLIRTLGKEAYGFYPLISNIVSYSNIATSAIGSMAGRFITMELYNGRKDEAEGYFNSVLLANWGLSLIFSLLLLIGVIYLSDVLTIPSHLIFDVKWIFIFSCLAMIISFNSDLLGIGTYVKNRIDLNSLMRMAVAVVNVLCIIFLFSSYDPTIIFIGIASFLSALVGIGFNIHYKRTLLPELSIRPVQKFSFAKIKTLLSSGIWNSINQLSNILLTHVDLLITNIFLGASLTGDFSLVKMAPNLIYTLLALLSGSFIPNFNILYAQRKDKELLHEIKKSMKIVGVLICIPLSFLLVFSDEFFSLWVPSVDSNFLYWLSFITVLPMILGSSINPIFGVFTITNRLKLPSLVLLATGIITTIAIILLLRFTNMGIWAIPVVGAIQHAVRNFLFTPIYASVCLGQKRTAFYPTVLKCCIALIVACMVGFTIKNLILDMSWTSLILKASLLSIISIAINSYVILNYQERAFVVNMLKGFVKL